MDHEPKQKRTDKINKNGFNSLKRKFSNVQSDEPFSRILEEDDLRFRALELRILDKVKEVNTNRHTVFSSVIKNVTPQQYYLKKCITEQHLALPLLDKVRGKTLVLQSYALSKAHCIALAAASKEFDHSKVNRVNFENCGISD